MKKLIKWIVLILWMSVIFIFSNQPAEISNEHSRLVINLFNLIGLNLNSTFGEFANFVVRKSAHFTEYLILYLLIYTVISDEFKVKNVVLLSIAGVFLYACSDEFHQTFVLGRNGNLKDVLIDTSAGVVTGTIIYLKDKMKQ